MNVEKRQEIERKVVRRLIRDMKAAGWVIAFVDDGEERHKDVGEKEAMEAVFSVDESWIRFKKGDMPRTAYIVLGNDGWDCICDHSVSDPELPDDDFEKVMDAVCNYAETFCE